jgi:hypothetical protein
MIPDDWPDELPPDTELLNSIRRDIRAAIEHANEFIHENNNPQEQDNENGSMPGQSEHR